MASREEELDERIISLQLDNRSFEKSADQTIKTLDKLQNAMDLEDAGKGISGATTSMLAFEAATDAAHKKFDLFDVVKFSAIEKIVGQVIDKVERFVKSVTLEPLTSGWAKYEEETASVQTIMAATKLSIEEVEEELKRLSTFSDETSYSYADMTNNVGKFTSQNVPLNEAVSAMEGIALWAAKSGQNSATAARAMYNMSQALGVGSVKLMDWRSIENANMATTEFKQLVLDTAVELGTLTKVGDKYYAKVTQASESSAESVQKSTKKTFNVTKNAFVETEKVAAKAASNIGGTAEVSIENFSQSLSEGWFSKDVLLETLDTYGQGVKTIETYMETHGLRYMGEAVAAMKEEGYDFVNDIGLSSFIAAQEAKTWRDAVDSAKDAASTKWKDVWKVFFGNYDTARVFFTDVANAFYDWFIEPINNLNAILDKFDKIGGGDQFRGIAYDIMDAIYAISDAVYTGLGAVWSFFNDESVDYNASKLLGFVTRLRARLEDIGIFIRDENGSLILTEEASFTISEIVYNVSYVLDKIFSLVKRIGVGAGKIAKPILNFLGRVIAFVTDIITTIFDLNEEIGLTQTIGTILSEIFSGIASAVKKIFGTNDISDANEDTEGISENLASIRIDIDKVYDILSGINRVLSTVWDNAKKIGGSLKTLGSTLLHGLFGEDIGDGFIDTLLEIINTIGEATVAVIDFITYLVKLATGSEDLDTAKNSIKDFFQPFLDFFINFETNHPEIYSALATVWSWVKNIATFIWGFIKWYYEIVKGWVEEASFGDVLSAILTIMVMSIANSVKSISETIGDITGTFLASAKSSMFRSLALAFIGIGIAIIAFAGAMKIVESLKDPVGAMNLVVWILAIVLIAVGLMSIIVKQLTDVKPEKKSFMDIIAGVLGQNKSPIDQLSKLVIAIALSVIILVFAIKMLADAFANGDYGDKIMTSFWLIILVIAVIFAGVIGMLAMARGLEKGSISGLWLVTLIIVLGMVSLMKQITKYANAVSGYSGKKIMAIGGSIALIFAAVGAAIALAAAFKPDENAVKAIKAMASVILVIGICLGAIGFMLSNNYITWEDLLVAGGIIAGLFLVMSVIAKAFLDDLDPSAIYAVTIAIIGIAIAIVMVVYMIGEYMKDMDPKQIWSAAGALAVLIGVLTALPLIFLKLDIRPIDFILMAAGIIIIAAAIAVVTYSLYKLSEKGSAVWDAAGSILLLIGVLGLLALAAGYLGSKSMYIWLGILIIGLLTVVVYALAQSVKTTADAFEILQNLPIDFMKDLAKASFEVGIAFIVLGAGAFVLGLGAAIAGLGILVLYRSLSELQGLIGEENFAKLVDNVTDLSVYLGPIAEDLVKIADALEPIFSKLWDLIEEVLDPILDIIGEIFDIVGDLISGIGQLISKGWNGITSWWNSKFGDKKGQKGQGSTTHEPSSGASAGGRGGSFAAYTDDLKEATGVTRGYTEAVEEMDSATAHLHSREKRVGEGAVRATIKRTEEATEVTREYTEAVEEAETAVEDTSAAGQNILANGATGVMGFVKGIGTNIKEGISNVQGMDIIDGGKDALNGIMENMGVNMDLSGVTQKLFGIEPGQGSDVLSSMFSGAFSKIAGPDGTGAWESILPGITGGQGSSVLTNGIQSLFGNSGVDIGSAIQNAIGPETTIGKLMSGDMFGENFISSGLGKFFSGEALAENPALSNPVEISQTINVKHEFPVLQVQGTADDGTLTEVSNSLLADIYDEVMSGITVELVKEARMK